MGSGQRVGERAGDELAHHEDREPGGQGEPRCLYAFLDCCGAFTGAVPAGRTARGAVREDSPDPGGHGQDAAAEGQRGERGTPQVPDDRGVHEDVQRFGGEDDEGG